MDKRYTEYRLGIKLAINEEEVYYTGVNGEYITREEFLADKTGMCRRMAQWKNQGMTVEDNVELGTRDFGGLMAVLAEMHKAVTALDARHGA